MNNIDFSQWIRDIADFPKPGIIFKDITPLLLNVKVYKAAIEAMSFAFAFQKIDCVVGTEARGFLFAPPVALELGASFVPVRKPGKLPGKILEECYSLEYGTDKLQMHEGQIQPGWRVLIADDLLASGGTVGAAARLVECAGGIVVGFSFLIELSFLAGREKLGDRPIFSLIQYDHDK